jgi:23S rRNA pseudouridine2605 synthase
MEERIQKILSRAGYGSRRACEELILAGRVRVNGRVAQIGEKADAQNDHISLDGKTIAAAEELVYIALHKPRNVLSTVEAPDPRPTVIDLVPVKTSVYPVGRLDFESEGLILLTNDGDLANRLLHPRYGHQKEYRVLVARHPDADQLEAFKHGVVLEDGYRTAPAEVRVESLFGKGAWLNVILREGRKRQIREVCTRLGLPVVRIIRVRIGSLHLGALKPREWRYLSPQEVQALKDPKSQKKGAASKRTGSRPGSRRPADKTTVSRKGSPVKSGSIRKGSSKPGTGKSSSGRPGSGKPGSVRPGSSKSGPSKSWSGRQRSKPAPSKHKKKAPSNNQ